MKIRLKSMLIIIVAVVILVLFIEAALFNIMVGNANDKEDQRSEATIERVVSEIDHQTQDIDALCNGWACWDDTYQFAQDHNQQFIDSYLNTGSLSNLDINIIVIIDKDGNNVTQIRYDGENDLVEPLSNDVLDSIMADPILQNHVGSPNIYGLMNLPGGLCMISSWEILHSNNTGPSVGTLVFGKFIDADSLEVMTETAAPSISIADVNSVSNISSWHDPIQELIEGSKISKINVDESSALVFSLVNNIDGERNIVIVLNLDRDFYVQTVDEFKIIGLAMWLLAACMIGIIYVLLNRMVISRLTDLEKDLKDLDGGGKKGEHLRAEGDDEIRSLSEQINSMIESLEKKTQELRESEELYKSLMEQSAEAVIIVDPSSLKILKSNPTFNSLFGYSTEETIRLDVSALLPDGTEPSIVRRILKERHIVGLEARLKTKSGRIIDTMLSGSTIEYMGNRAVCITGWDITDQLRMEATQDKLVRLEAVGNLAGGMAHDFNNLLTSIIGNTSLLESKMGSDPENIERLRNLEMAATRAKEIAQELMTLSKGGEPLRQEIDISTLIQNGARVYLHDSRVNFVFSIPQGLWSLNADPNQMSRVFLNLFLNAKEAMPNGGLVEVSVKNCVFSEGEIHPLAAGNYLLITVKDNGVGIPPEIVTKIFDPYFTTKKTGSGIGLSVVYSIIRRHGGTIDVESEAGKGTTFRIILPAIEGMTPKGTAAERNVCMQQSVGKHRVLLMDDQDAVIEVSSEMLHELGYEVEVARDGLEALKAYARSMEEGKKFDAVIMDLTVPQGMGGKEAVKRLLEIDPGAKAIVSSGYSSDPVMSNYMQYGFVGVLPKPFKMEDMAYIVHNVCSMQGN